MIARVFPTKTSMSPTDEHAYFGPPEPFTPKYSEIHVSVTFTWDIPKAEELAKTWFRHGLVLMGGPAFDDPGGQFIPGKYTKTGVTITSRGCPNSCFFCHVSKREGQIRELEIHPGNVIQDNNLLACSEEHLDRVFSMLDTQKGVQFKGGLEASRVTPRTAERISGLKTTEIWLACDTPKKLSETVKAVSLFRSYGVKTYKLRCFVLIGFDMAEEDHRLKTLLSAGVLPFTQLYRGNVKKEYSKEWKAFNRLWARPAAYKSVYKALLPRKETK